MNPWILLAAAILVEVAGTLCLKFASDATTFGGRVAPGIGVAVFYGSTLYLMAVTMKSLDVGTTYTIWAGAGTALVTVAGIVLFKESFAWPKLAGVALVAAGVMVLHFATEHAPPPKGQTIDQAGQPAAPAASPDQPPRQP